ncbi:MAG: aldo/keto reductase [Anaerolineaceae bacterium]|nr:aldo/keto reductase [Anaerolineaceae bacterium]
MKHRKLGNSGLLVSEIALGTMIFGEESDRSASLKTSKAMIFQFLDAGATISQIALAWLRKQKAVAAVIVEVRTPAQLTDNLGAAELNLRNEEVAKLNAVSALEKGYPYRFVQKYGARTL